MTVAGTKPLLLIDADGVLNPYEAGRMPAGYAEYGLLGVRVWLNPDHGAWLLRLTDRFDLVWATTWEEFANDLIAPRIGISPLPMIAFPGERVGSTWKLPAVSEYVGDRPFAWLEDDLYDDVYAWAEARTQPTLLVKTDPAVGLIEDHIRQCETFADQLTTDPAANATPGP
jgi:HAD domain in Swiss Army Knife RNA repair proteins